MLKQDVSKVLDETLEKMFCNLAEKHNLPTGDISPMQVVTLDDCKEKLSAIFVEYVEQNTVPVEPNFYNLEATYKTSCCIEAESEEKARQIVKDNFKQDFNINLEDEEIVSITE